MKTNKDIFDKVKSTMNAFDTIQDVKVSPFLKDKTIHRLFGEREQELSWWSWFTPKLQLATLTCLFILNVIAFIQVTDEDYNANVEEFVEAYELEVEDESYLLN